MIFHTTYTLANSVSVPAIGFGTFLIKDPAECVASVKTAIARGYRHIDTAAVYENEAAVGRGLRESGVPRSELFVTSKVWNTERGYDKTLRAFDASLKLLNLEYLDLYLIHWPAVAARYPDYRELNASSWKALVKLYRDGRVRAVGVSNFLVPHLTPLLDSEVPPMVDQIEFHPGYRQPETVELCRRSGILVEAWSPLGRGALLNNPLIKNIAAKHNKNAAQLCVRYCLEHGVLPLVKSANAERMTQNLAVEDFSLAPADLAILDALGGNLGFSGSYPETFRMA